MDVRSWLQHTVDRASPDPGHSEPTKPPGASPGSPDEGVKRRRKYRRKRKRVRDSPLSTRASDSPHDVRRLSDNDSSSVETDLTRSDYVTTTKDCEALDEVSGDVSIRGPYDRRTRRKTRADRYEPNRRRTKNAQFNKPKWATKRTQRNDKRGKDGMRTQDLVQSFQMKKGPKKTRLTLPVRNSLGIFKHGRASHQTSGGRSGLPDLAFNEMKFLQKVRPEDGKETSRDSPVKSRENRTRKDEEERISTYFQTGNQSSKHASRRLPDRPRSSTYRNLASDPNLLTRTDTISVSRLEPIPILSSDSQQLPQPGNDHVEQGDQDGSDHPSRCLTWSISVADKSLVSLPSLPSDLVRGHDNTRADASRYDDRIGFEAEENSPAVQRRLAEYGSNNSDPIQNPRTHTAPLRQANVPIEQATESVHRKATLQGNRGTPTYRTLSILRVGANLSATPDPIEPRHAGKADSTVDKENLEPIRSTPSSSVLRMAFSNINGHTFGEREAYQTKRQELPDSEHVEQSSVAQFGKRPPKGSAEWSPAVPLGSNRPDVQVRMIPQRGLRRTPGVVSMLPVITAAQRPDLTGSFEPRLRPHRPDSAVLQHYSSRHQPSAEPRLSLPGRFSATDISHKSSVSGLHPGPYEWRTRSSVYDPRGSVDAAPLLDHGRSDGDGHFKVHNDAHEEDSPTALLAWDELQATQDFDRHCSRSPSHNYHPDVQLRGSDIQRPDSYLEDYRETVGGQHDYQQSIDDRPPSPQELPGFWKQQKFY